MKKISLTRGLFALVDDKDYEWLNQWKWYAYKGRNTFYAYKSGRKLSGRYTIIIMHRLILGLSDKKIQSDHKDGNGLNNQRSNLRPATCSQNGANFIHKKKGSSKYFGVCWRSDINKWQVRLKKNKIIHHLGVFNSERRAAIAYDKAAKIHHGEFANLNKI